jgi:hypothetical protein
VAAQFDSALLLQNTPTGRGITGINISDIRSFDISTLMMGTEEIPETLVFSSTFPWLLAREDFST